MRCGHSLTGSKVVELHVVAISTLSSILDRCTRLRREPFNSRHHPTVNHDAGLELD